jgi:hypothetical protein
MAYNISFYIAKKRENKKGLVPTFFQDKPEKKPLWGIWAGAIM